jgi:polyisoprenoid-binding protein YceI
MKTVKLFYLTALALGVGLASCSQGGNKQAEEGSSTEKSETTVEIASVTVDPGKSKVMWAGESFGVYTHTGTVTLKEADLNLKDGEITGGSFVVDLTKITTTDDNYDAEKGNTPDKLIGHLQSADFFDVASYPEAKFEITGVDGNTATGLLTIRGITNEEKVENIVMSKDGSQVKITGDLTFDRKKYDVAWDYPMKEMVLSDDVKLQIALIGS